jgi:hypothetical protein
MVRNSDVSRGTCGTDGPWNPPIASGLHWNYTGPRGAIIPPMTVTDLAARRRQALLATFKKAARELRRSEPLPSSAFIYPLGSGEFVAVGTQPGIHSLTAADSEWTLVATRLPTKKEWDASSGFFFVVWPGLQGVRAAFFDRERREFIGVGGVVPCTRWRAVVLPEAPEI